MASARVRVVSALSGRELLPATAVPCAELGERVRALLGSRPSLPVALLHHGVLVCDELPVAAVGLVELTAVRGDALSPEGRQRLLQKVAAADVGADANAVAQVFAGFSAAARDDKALVLAVMRVDGYCLEHASELCRNDREVVLAAVQQCGWSLQFAGEVFKTEKETVLNAVMGDSCNLQLDSELCQYDELVRVSVQQCGFNLECCH